MSHLATQAMNNESIQKFAKFMAYFALAILVTLMGMGMVHAAAGDDVLAGGATTVTKTFGAESTFAKWLILGEVIVGTFMYIKTKNLMLLGGVVVVVVFTTLGFQLAV